MKYQITYKQRHKEMLEYALNMALAWHNGNLEPLSQLLFDAYKRYNPEVQDTQNLEDALENIHKLVESLREKDTRGKAFGKYDVLSKIYLSDEGKTTLTEDEEFALEHLCEFVARLFIGQTDICFDWSNLPYIMDLQQLEEIREIATWLHVMCWNRPPHSYYGISHSEEGSILFDILQVLRYERYKNFSEEDKVEMQYTVMASPPCKAAKISLIRIKTIH